MEHGRYEKNKKHSSTSNVTMVALMAAVQCVLSPFSIPIGVIPISLATFGLYVAVIVLGGKKASLVCLIYLLMGFVGLPVFSGFSGGPAKLFGATGGYLIGYLLLTMIAGWIVDKFPKNHAMCVLGFLLGTAACYLLGTLWLAFQMKMRLADAFLIGVVPFLPADVIKIFMAQWLGTAVRGQIRKAGYIL